MGRMDDVCVICSLQFPVTFVSRRIKATSMNHECLSTVVAVTHDRWVDRIKNSFVSRIILIARGLAVTRTLECWIIASSKVVASSLTRQPLEHLFFAPPTECSIGAIDPFTHLLSRFHYLFIASALTNFLFAGCLRLVGSC